MNVHSRGSRGLMMLVMVLGSVLVAGPARGDSADDLADARARLHAAQSAANAASARYEEALATRAQLEADVQKTRQRLEEAEALEKVLEGFVQAIAVRAYVNSAEPTVQVLFEGDAVLDLSRTTRLLDRANAPNLATIDALVKVQDELAKEHDRLAAAEEESKGLIATLEEESERVQAELAAASEARRQIEARVAAERRAREQAAARAAAARAAEARRAAAATSTTAPRANQSAPAARPGTTPTTAKAPGTGTPTTPPTRPPTNPPPPSGDVLCPVRGAVSFVDSWGAPRSGGRSHQGVDMMAARGTPNVAIVPGTTTQKYGTLQGNGVTLHGDDGNIYHYFHLDSYAGSPRQVAAGEVIGYTGTTGNAEGTAPHTHFEYHPGGGGAVNPYPLVRAAC